MISEVTADELAEKLRSQDEFILLDVREPIELKYARIEDARLQLVPMSRLARQGVAALPQSARAQDALIYVLCHHGNRSADVTRWLSAQGWKNVFNVSGGIDDYARRIDRTVGMY